jgi:hypothetical protein
MDCPGSLKFTLKGVDFRIYGTVKEDEKYYELVENIETKKTGRIEGKKLKKMLQDERRERPN